VRREHYRPVTTPADPSSGSSRPARAAFWVGAGILFSRIAGFLRDAVLNFYLGNSRETDVWRAALRTPNVIQNLLGEGTLSASFIPVYAEFLEEGREEEAGRLAGAALGILTVVAFSVALLGILLAPYLVPLFFYRWDPEKQALTVHLVRIILPMSATLVVSAWALGILNSHRKFFVSYVAPVAWNLAIIAFLVFFGSFMGFQAAGRNADLVTMMAWGALAGGFLQLGVQLPWVLPLLSSFRLSLGKRVEGVGETIRNFMPVLASRGVVNLSSLLDMFLAGILAEAALSLLANAQTLYLLPISLFGMAIAASELPELSRNRKAVQEILTPRVRKALGRLAFLLIPSGLAFIFLGDVIIASLFKRGAFGAADTAAVHVILAAYALGLPASASSRALSSAFYAIRDTKTPATIAVVRMVISLAVGISLMFPLEAYGVGDFRFGAAGLALGATVGAWLEYILLRRALGRSIGSHGPGVGPVVRMVLAGFAAVGVGLGAKAFLGFSLVDGLLPQFLGHTSMWLDPVAALGIVGSFGLTYLCLTWALGVGMPLGRRS
jgi:putative peptidoglycan lipid II flippase